MSELVPQSLFEPALPALPLKANVDLTLGAETNSNIQRVVPSGASTDAAGAVGTSPSHIRPPTSLSTAGEPKKRLPKSERKRLKYEKNKERVHANRAAEREKKKRKRAALREQIVARGTELDEDLPGQIHAI